MRKLVWFLPLLLFLPASSFAASCSNTNVGNGWTCVISTSSALGANGGSTTGVTTTSATLILFAESEYAGGGAMPTPACTPTDTINGSPSGNSWTLIQTEVDAANLTRSSLWRVTGAPAVGVNHVITCTTTGIFSSGALFAYKGTGAISTDQMNGGNSQITTNVQPGSITPARANPLIVTNAATATNGANAASIDSSFTIVENITDVSGNNVALAVAHLTQGAAAAVNPTWTISATSTALSADIASFLYPVVTAGGKGQLMLLGVGK